MPACRGGEPPWRAGQPGVYGPLAVSLGWDALAHKWPGDLLYAFPPLVLISPTLERVRLRNLKVLLVAPAWGTWISKISPLLYERPWPLPPPTGSPSASQERDSPPEATGPRPLGLARVGENLRSMALPSNVVDTILNARASSTRTAYNHRWRLFDDWCTALNPQVLAFQAPLRHILMFL